MERIPIVRIEVHLRPRIHRWRWRQANSFRIGHKKIALIILTVDDGLSSFVEIIRHLMVRHGLLLPNSKLLPGVTSRATMLIDERPGSILSLVSNGG